jgi:hypothetical protein
VTRLGVRGQLRRTLASTNPCESMIECVRRSAGNRGRCAFAGRRPGCSRPSGSSARPRWLTRLPARET